MKNKKERKLSMTIINLIEVIYVKPVKKEFVKKEKYEGKKNSFDFLPF